MRLICMTTTALALGAAPAIAGVCPEAVMTSVRAAMVQSAVDEVEGALTRIAPDFTSFYIHQADDEIMKLTTDGNTVFTLDGEEVGRDLALAEGRHAKVTSEKGLASRVEVVTEK